MTEPGRETEEPSTPFRAVIFDLGGVVLGSPLHAIASFERELGIPAGFVNRVVVDTGASGAWARHERGELAREHFMREFSGECQSAGHALSVPDLFDRMAEVSHPRPRMLEAIRRIRARGLLTAALTNNFPSDAEDSGGRALRACFDDFFESSVLGLHKPDPRIYQHACRALDVAPNESVFLDDIGRNLKAARALGMATIKVDEPATALGQLEALLGFALG
ncbi:MAG: HAD family phosphatase [Myxococcota bacterium]